MFLPRKDERAEADIALEKNEENIDHLSYRCRHCSSIANLIKVIIRAL